MPKNLYCGCLVGLCFLPRARFFIYTQRFVNLFQIASFNLTWRWLVSSWDMIFIERKDATSFKPFLEWPRRITSFTRTTSRNFCPPEGKLPKCGISLFCGVWIFVPAIENSQASRTEIPIFLFFCLCGHKSLCLKQTTSGMLKLFHYFCHWSSHFKCALYLGLFCLQPTFFNDLQTFGELEWFRSLQTANKNKTTHLLHAFRQEIWTKRSDMTLACRTLFPQTVPILYAFKEWKICVPSASHMSRHTHTHTCFAACQVQCISHHPRCSNFLKARCERPTSFNWSLSVTTAPSKMNLISKKHKERAETKRSTKDEKKREREA